MDPFTIGSSAYPIAKDLLKLAKMLREVYEGVRYAKRNFKKVMDKTEIVAGTYQFFKKTMQDVEQIEKVERIFAQHGDLIRKIEDESKRIVDKLKGIKGIFWFLESGKLVSLTDQWIGHYQWYRESKKTIPGLFQDMEVLESSMRTIGILVNTHILLHVSNSEGSGQLQARIKYFTMVLNIESRKLQHGNPQHKVSSTERPEPASFAQQVIQILNEEIPQLGSQGQPPDNTSTSDSTSTSTSRESDPPSPITPPLTPPGPSNEDQAVDVKSKKKMPSQKVRGRRIPLKSPEQILVPSPTSSVLPTETEVNNQVQEDAEQEIHEQDQDQGRQEDAYIQMPAVAPPESGPHHLPNAPQDRNGQRKNGSQYQGPYHSTWERRKNDSKVSVYANGGAAFPYAGNKLMGLGLPVQNRKGKNREKQ